MLAGQDEFEPGIARRAAQCRRNEFRERRPRIAPAGGIAFEDGPPPAGELDQARLRIEQLAQLGGRPWRWRDLRDTGRRGEGAQAGEVGMHGSEVAWARRWQGAFDPEPVDRQVAGGFACLVDRMAVPEHLDLIDPGGELACVRTLGEMVPDVAADRHAGRASLQPQRPGRYQQPAARSENLELGAVVPEMAVGGVAQFGGGRR